MSYQYLYILLFFLLSPLYSTAQSISGYIYNEQNEPIPFANVYVKETAFGTSADIEGKYFLRLEAQGTYNIVVSSVGYKTINIELVFEENDLIKDIQLQPSSVELNEIVVKASKRDPAYEIIQKVVKNKKTYLASTQSYRTEIYVKATEDIFKKEKQKNKEKEVSAEKQNPTEIDPFEEQKKENEALLGRLNLLEMQVTLNYQYPKQYKEERTAYKKYGTEAGLFIPRFGETDFNFYRNLVSMTGIAETPVISPISRTAILSYKYKLEASVQENGTLVHKIKVTPRKKGNATVSGYIYINDEIWNINRLDFDFYRGGLKFFDAFNLKQKYEQVDGQVWIPVRQELSYETKQGRYKTFRGNTTLRYADFKHNYSFPANFFGSEVAITTKEAYKRDSSYWNALRPEPLTIEQQKIVFLRDSIETVHNSEAYKDSVQAEFNKVTFLEVIWDGVAFRNHKKLEQLWFGPIASFWDFSVVGGVRMGVHTGYSRRWKNGQYLSTYAQPTYGFANKDVIGTASANFRYNPHHLANVGVYLGRTFSSINPDDAILRQLNAGNFILHDVLELEHRIELVNGLYVDTDFLYSDRQSISNYKTVTFLNDWFGEYWQENNENTTPLEFTPYQTFITDIELSYTPAQRYMTEPNRKVVLDSPYPTFSLTYRKGWKGLFSSDIDFDYVEAEINQKLQIGTIGTSNYSVKSGKFLNTKRLKFIDLKRFRQSDPILFSNAKRTFQSLDTSLTTTNLFIEFHHIHHFNGALINNIPFLKRTRIRAVAGGGILWLPDLNLRHEELFAGIERVFKLGVRRRLRLGIYGVVSNSNFSKARINPKISIDIIDTWKRDWSF